MCEYGWCLQWSPVTIGTKTRATPSVTRDSPSPQTTSVKSLFLIRLIPKMLSKKLYGPKHNLLSETRFFMVRMQQSSLMGKQQVERPSQFKAQKKNLASSSVRSHIWNDRLSDVMATWLCHAGWERSTCKSSEISLENLVTKLNPCGSTKMALFQELLYLLQITLKI